MHHANANLAHLFDVRMIAYDVFDLTFFHMIHHWVYSKSLLLIVLDGCDC